MTRAEAIVMAAAGDYDLTHEIAESVAVRADQYWASETTVYTLPDDSRVFLSGPDFWTYGIGRKQEMLVELMEAREYGATRVWYGNVENAEPVDIADAIVDIMQMEDVGAGSWGEWDDDKCPLPGYECDHDGGCDTCPHKS